MRNGLLFVVSGPSGVGKSTLCKEIVRSIPGVRLSVSYTTRSSRLGEEHGKDYWFLEEKEFRAMIEREEFAEWAEVYGHLYGTPRRELIQTREQGVDVVLDIDVQGARQVMKQVEEAVSLFVMPPSLEALNTRLMERGTDTVDAMKRRFRKAQEEMRHYMEYDYAVSNENLEQAIKTFESIIIAERVRTKRVDYSKLVENHLSETETLENPHVIK